MTNERIVDVAPSFRIEVGDTIGKLDITCGSGVFMLIEELKNPDPKIQPDVDERCGLLANKREIYALDIPGCDGFYLVISLDCADPLTGPVILHGAIAAKDQTCEVGRAIATRHFKLNNPIWEPATPKWEPRT